MKKSKGKRNSLHVNQVQHGKIKKNANKSKKTITNYINDICLDIANDKHEDLIELNRNANLKTIPVNQELSQLVQKKIGDTQYSVKSILLDVIEKEHCDDKKKF